MQQQQQKRPIVLKKINKVVGADPNKQTLQTPSSGKQIMAFASQPKPDETTIADRLEELARQYDLRLQAIEQTRKMLGDKIKQWQTEQRKIHGSDKNPKAKKSDPICQDFLQYQ